MNPKNCLRCSRYLMCREPQKGPKFSCSNFSKLQEIANIGDIVNLQMVPDGEDEDLVVLSKKPRQKSAVGPSYSEVMTAEIELATGSPAQAAEPVAASGERSLVKRGQTELPDNFVWQAMQEAYDPYTNTVRDVKVDDRDLILSDSYFHFCKSVAGPAIKMPFSRQLWVALHLFGEYCPRCTSPKFQDITKVPVDMDPEDLKKRVAVLQNGVCPHCSATKSALVLGEELRDFNQLVMVVGQRGGKSAFTATVSGYHFHRILKAPKLSNICRGIQEFTPLTYTFVALSATRAIKLLWSPFHSIVEHSTWFQDYFKMLNHHGEKLGKELYKSGDLFIRLFYKNIDLYSSGPMKRTLRGDTRLLAATDELGWFPYTPKANPLGVEDEDDDSQPEEQEDERERANGDEVHTALDNSLSTVRTEVFNLYSKGVNTIPTGMNLAISSPQSWLDKICRLYKDSENPESMSLGVKLATWEINPLFSRNHPVIKAAYATQPKKAERDFGANPPRQSGTTFKQERILPLFNARQHFAVKYDLTNPERTSGRIIELIQRASWPPSILTADAGQNNNSFALALGYPEEATVQTLATLELIPAPHTNIDFPGVFANVIQPIIEKCNVVVFAADRWNSIEFLQRAEDISKGKCKSFQKTLQPQDFDNFITFLDSNSMTLPELTLDPEVIEQIKNYKRDLKGRPGDHLYLQMRTVQMLQGVFSKGPGYTDDILRAVVMLQRMAFDKVAAKHMAKYKIETRSGLSTRATALVAGRSGLVAMQQGLQ